MEERSAVLYIADSTCSGYALSIHSIAAGVTDSSACDGATTNHGRWGGSRTALHDRQWRIWWAVREPPLPHRHANAAAMQNILLHPFAAATLSIYPLNLGLGARNLGQQISGFAFKTQFLCCINGRLDLLADGRVFFGEGSDPAFKCGTFEGSSSWG